MPRTLKKPTTFPEQLEILKARGCVVEDETFCLKTLSTVNYYRLSAYFLPFKTAADKYVPGTSFNRICRLYDFDKELRSAIFSAIEEIEIFLRCQISYHFSHKYGPLGYLDKGNFSKVHDHEKFTRHIEREIAQNKKIPFIKHHSENYGGHFPLWVLIEIFTFGMLSFFFCDLKPGDMKSLSRELFGNSHKNISSQIHACSVMRNICAHYWRLYYRNFSAIPGGVRRDETSKRKLWAQLLCVKSLFPSAAKWNSLYAARFANLLDEFQCDVSPGHIGFPQNWREELFKQPS